METVQEIERAITTLNREQLNELYNWLDEYDDYGPANQSDEEDEAAKLAWLRNATEEAFAEIDAGNYTELKSAEEIRAFVHASFVEAIGKSESEAA